MLAQYNKKLSSSSFRRRLERFYLELWPRLAGFGFSSDFTSGRDEIFVILVLSLILLLTPEVLGIHFEILSLIF